jgi:hypothetical protein
MTEQVDTYRQDSLARILYFLQSKLREYQGSKGVCPLGLQCSAMVLGSLTVGLNEIGVLQSPDPPYVGFRFRKLTNQLKEMEILHFGQSCHPCGEYGDYWECMGLKNDILEEIDAEVNCIRGLRLQNYNNPSKP